MTPSMISGSSKIWTDKSRLTEVHTTYVKTSTSKDVLVFTNKGNAFKVDVNGLPISKFKEKGIEFAKLVNGLTSGEVPVAIIENPTEENDKVLLFFTKQGMIKKTVLNEYIIQKSSYQAMKLKDGDELISIEFDRPDTTIMFVTKKGMGLNAEKSDIPEQGRISGGVKGVMLADDDLVVSANQVVPGQNIVLVTDAAYAKQINVSEVDVLARYRKGVKVFDLKGKASSGENVICSGVFADGDEVVIVTSEEEYSAISISTISEDLRNGKGKSLSVETKNVSLAVIRHNSAQ
jgi:DNA gyrase/topoisomerase IV subunit A